MRRWMIAAAALLVVVMLGASLQALYDSSFRSQELDDEREARVDGTVLAFEVRQVVLGSSKPDEDDSCEGSLRRQGSSVSCLIDGRRYGVTFGSNGSFTTRLFG